MREFGYRDPTDVFGIEQQGNKANNVEAALFVDTTPAECKW